MTDEELAEYYDTHSTVPDFIKAEKNGDLIFCKVGESALDAIKKHKAEKRAAVAAKAAMQRRAVAAAVL